MYVLLYNKLPKCFPEELHHFASPPVLYESSSCSTCSPQWFIILSLAFFFFGNFRHSNSYGLLPHCSVNSDFPNELWRWASFNVLIFYTPTLVKYPWKYFTLFPKNKNKKIGFIVLLLDFNNFKPNSVCKSFVRHLICKYFLPVYHSAFHSFNSTFQRAKVLLCFAFLILMKSNFLLFKSNYDLCFGDNI